MDGPSWPVYDPDFPWIRGPLVWPAFLFRGAFTWITGKDPWADRKQQLQAKDSQQNFTRFSEVEKKV